MDTMGFLFLPKYHARRTSSCRSRSYIHHHGGGSSFGIKSRNCEKGFFQPVKKYPKLSLSKKKNPPPNPWTEHTHTHTHTHKQASRLGTHIAIRSGHFKNEIRGSGRRESAKKSTIKDTQMRYLFHFRASCFFFFFQYL